MFVVSSVNRSCPYGNVCLAYTRKLLRPLLNRGLVPDTVRLWKGSIPKIPADNRTGDVYVYTALIRSH